MSKKYQLKKLDIINSLFLIITPLLAILFTSLHFIYESFSWNSLIVAIIFYIFTGFSITAGYHRLFSHRSYKAHPFIKLFFLVFGAATFQNSLLKWASDHRKHHTSVDTPNDPYNINEGFFYAHMGWIMLKQEDDISGVNDLKADPLVMWQHRNYLAIATFFGIILPTLIGQYFGSLWAALGIVTFARITFVHHATFFINSLCHYLGKQTYSDTHTAKDSIIMAFLTFGEGYHNFHHEFQIDYRNGIKWYQYDPIKWLISLFSSCGLVWDLKTAPQADILKSFLLMKEKKLPKKLNIAGLVQLREMLILNMKKLEQIKKEYKNKNVSHWKLELKNINEEFNRNLKQWNNLYSQMLLA